MKFFLIALTIYSSVSHGIETAQCPDSISISYETLSPASNSRLYEQAKNWSNLDVQSLYNELIEARGRLMRAQPRDYQVVTFQLSENVRSQCRYAPLDEEGRGDNELRVYTRDGKDTLRVALNVGGEHFWVYHTIEKYSLKGISVRPTKGSAVLGIFDHGGPKFSLGWVSNPVIEVQ